MVTLTVETEASAESRTLSGAVPESIRGHCSVNLNRTLVVLNSSDGYLCPRETLRSTPMLELDGRIVLAGVSTCTVAEQAKTAERAGAAALLVSPELISHDIPGARSGPSVARPCTPVLHERLAVGNLRWTVMQLSGPTTLPSAKAIASLSTPLATRHPLLRTAHHGTSRRRRCAATNATGSRLASGTRGRQVGRGAFDFSSSTLPTMAAFKITVRAECILYGGFGTFDGMVELRTSLSQHNLNWQCTEGSTVTSSNRRPGGPRCWLKGAHAVCLTAELTVAERTECA